MEERDEQPSYVMVRFHRISGGHMSLFGSELKHDSSIRLDIHHAYADRSNYEDKYNAAGRMPVVSVTMSDLQFAELITTMNVARGVPGTMTYLEGVGRIPHKEVPPRRVLYDKEVDDNCRVAVESLSELETAIRSVKMTERDRQMLLGKVSKSRNSITDSLPFLKDMFREYMDKATNEAKAHIEGFVTGIAHRFGMKALSQATAQDVRNIVALPDATQREIEG